MLISLIVALTHDARVIGNLGTLPWRLSADLKRFKQLTMGHHLIMGRKTFESIGRALPGRTSIVVSQQKQLFPTQTEHLKLAPSLDDAIAMCGNDSEVFIIGGGEIFREALATAQRAYVTWVMANLPGDTFFPEFPLAGWHLVSEESIPQDEKNEFTTRYCVYEQVG